MSISVNWQRIYLKPLKENEAIDLLLNLYFQDYQLIKKGNSRIKHKKISWKEFLTLKENYHIFHILALIKTSEFDLFIMGGYNNEDQLDEIRNHKYIRIPIKQSSQSY